MCRGVAEAPEDPIRDIAGQVAALRARPELVGAAITAADAVVRLSRDGAVVVLAPWEALASHGSGPLAAGLGEDAGLVVVGHPGAARLSEILRSGRCAVLPADADADAVVSTVARLLDHLVLARAAASRELELATVRGELGELVRIARAITQERDLNRLLDLILSRSRSMLGADAGSIYVVEDAQDPAAPATLRFKLSHNDSVPFASREFTMPVSLRSIAGAAVLGREPIVLADVQDLPEDAPYDFDPSFDWLVGYTTRSMITVPLVSAEEEVIGVIQLINRKRDPSARLVDAAAVEREVVPFDARCRELLVTLASQAAIALENALLYEEIRAIFEGFVRASVQAIEQRDPTTSGHSFRVSLLAGRLAQMVDRTPTGRYGQVRFGPRDLNELEYASLLHDFGKIGVREQVLVKAKKLYPHQLEVLEQRVHYAALRAELDVVREALASERPVPTDVLEQRVEERRRALVDVLAVVREANEPTVLPAAASARLEEVAALTFRGPDGALRPVLEAHELEALRVPRGSLSGPEMDEIRSHVVHTRKFLEQIPWGRSLARIPEIAGGHHERLDGSGYPRGLVDHEIPVASKVMTVADIYDALTARDRPYKRAIPHDRAMAILDAEVRDGHVCGELVRIFREAEVHRVVDDAPARWDALR